MGAAGALGGAVVASLGSCTTFGVGTRLPRPCFELDAELDASATSSSTDEEDADDAGAASGAESESGAALAAARSVPMLENFLPRPLPM